MATHSRILAWENPMSAEPVRLQRMGSQRVTTANGAQRHGNFAGGLVVENPCFHRRGLRFDPWSGN